MKSISRKTEIIIWSLKWNDIKCFIWHIFQRYSQKSRNTLACISKSIRGNMYSEWMRWRVGNVYMNWISREAQFRRHSQVHNYKLHSVWLRCKKGQIISFSSNWSVYTLNIFKREFFNFVFKIGRMKIGPIKTN